MPKEIIHLAIANASARRIPENSIFHQPVRQYPNLFLYGAVAPDTCFYYFFGLLFKKVSLAGNRFHVSDNTALLPVLSLLKEYKSSPDALAFAAGLCCHLMTDTLFHPMVFYFCGMDALHEGASSRHRAFETAMDLHFAFENPSDCRRDLRFYKITGKPGITRQRIKEFLGILFAPDKKDPVRKHMPYAFHFHRAGTRLFDSHVAYRILTFAMRAGIKTAEPFQTLAYPSPKPVPLTFFNRTIAYRDPETGREFKTRIKQMGILAGELTLQLIDVIAGHMTSDLCIKKVFSDPALPVIRPCPPGDAQRFKYWSQNKNLISHLYQGLKT